MGCHVFHSSMVSDFQRVCRSAGRGHFGQRKSLGQYQWLSPTFTRSHILEYFYPLLKPCHIKYSHVWWAPFKTRIIMNLLHQRLREKGFFDSITSAVKKFTSFMIEIASGSISDMSSTVCALLEAIEGQDSSSAGLQTAFRVYWTVGIGVNLFHPSKEGHKNLEGKVKINPGPWAEYIYHHNSHRFPDTFYPCIKYSKKRLFIANFKIQSRNWSDFCAYHYRAQPYSRLECSFHFLSFKYLPARPPPPFFPAQLSGRFSPFSLKLGRGNRGVRVIVGATRRCNFEWVIPRKIC